MTPPQLAAALFGVHLHSPSALLLNRCQCQTKDQTMTTQLTSPSLVAFAAQALRLQSLLAQTGEAQWQPSQTPRPREDTTERAKGGHGDPTLSTVVDDRRLILRAAVIDAERELDRSRLAMGTAEERLSEALDRWHGVDVLSGDLQK